jgi:hypothetical protein
MSLTDRVLTSRGPRTAREETEHEFHECHPAGHGIDASNRRDCTEWKRSRSSTCPDHRRSTDACADADPYFTDRDCAEVLSAEIRTSLNEQITAPVSADPSRRLPGLDLDCIYSTGAQFGWRRSVGLQFICYGDRLDEGRWAVTVV